MRSIAYQRYKYTADVYKVYSETVGDELISKYYFSNKILLSINLRNNAKLIVRSQEPLPIGTIIANLKDSDNNLVLDDTLFQITGLQPVMNCFNSIEEYSMTTAKWNGTL